MVHSVCVKIMNVIYCCLLFLFSLFLFFLPLLLFSFILETESYVGQTSPKLTTQLKMTLHS